VVCDGIIVKILFFFILITNNWREILTTEFCAISLKIKHFEYTVSDNGTSERTFYGPLLYHESLYSIRNVGLKFMFIYYVPIIEQL